MSLFICSLNSGSNGNCYYVGNNDEAILVDAGISCREIERRMQQCGLHLKNVRALFISHEHSDHITGVRVLSKKYSIPVYITEQTLKYSELALDRQLSFIHFRQIRLLILAH
jgi:phosphoribosyl 1,2-cyclic phosphodiesterase